MKRKASSSFSARKRFKGRSMVKNAVARASGATLGYIAGNVPGAVAGYKAAPLLKKYFSKWRKRFQSSSGHSSGYKVGIGSGQKNIGGRHDHPVISKHNDLTTHDLGACKLGRAVKPKFKSVATYKFRNINQWVIESDQGRQKSDWPETIMHRDMIVGTTSSSRTERVKLPDELFKLNPFWAQQNTASTVYPNLVNTDVSRTDVLYIKNVVSEIALLNMTTTATLVDVYWMTPVNDTERDPSEAWTDCMTTLTEGQASSTNASDIATGTATAGGGNVDNWGENPFSNRYFRRAWKAIKVSKMILQPGDQRVIKTKINYEKVIAKHTFAENRLLGFLKGLTVVPFIIARAGLVGLSTAEGVDSSEVAYGKAKVGLIHNQLYTFGAVPIKSRNTLRVYKGAVEATTNVSKMITDEDLVDTVAEN